MADTAKRAGPSQLTTSAATYYTVPASTSAILRYMRFNNTAGSDRTITVSVGASAAATQIFTTMTVPANSALDWSGFIPMTTGEIVQALCSAATSITMTVGLVEVT